MHRSRRAGFIIDCQNADLASASRFWSKALGTANEPSTGSDVRLDTKNRDLVVDEIRDARVFGSRNERFTDGVERLYFGRGQR